MTFSLLSGFWSWKQFLHIVGSPSHALYIHKQVNTRVLPHYPHAIQLLFDYFSIHSFHVCDKTDTYKRTEMYPKIY